MIRRVATIAGALATGTLLGACGASSHPAKSAATTSTSPGASPARGTTGPASARAKRAAGALAGAINLRAADVPGFRAATEREHETAAEKRLEHELLRCIGGPGAKSQLAEVSSPQFERLTRLRAQGAQSGVTVQRTPALAASELQGIRGPRVRACLTHYLELLLAGREHRVERIAPVSISEGTPPAAGAAGSFDLRIRTAIVVRGIPVPTYFDILGFVAGPAEVTLFTEGLPKPFPAATEERLYSLLLARAKAHAR